MCVISVEICIEMSCIEISVEISVESQTAKKEANDMLEVKVCIIHTPNIYFNDLLWFNFNVMFYKASVL